MSVPRAADVRCNSALVCNDATHMSDMSVLTRALSLGMSLKKHITPHSIKSADIGADACKDVSERRPGKIRMCFRFGEKYGELILNPVEFLVEGTTVFDTSLRLPTAEIDLDSAPSDDDCLLVQMIHYHSEDAERDQQWSLYYEKRGSELYDIRDRSLYSWSLFEAVEQEEPPPILEAIHKVRIKIDTQPWERLGDPDAEIELSMIVEMNAINDGMRLKVKDLIRYMGEFRVARFDSQDLQLAAWDKANAARAAKRPLDEGEKKQRQSPRFEFNRRQGQPDHWFASKRWRHRAKDKDEDALERASPRV